MESVIAQAFLNEIREALLSMKKMKGAFQELESENWSIAKSSHTQLGLPQFNTCLAGYITHIAVTCTSIADTEENNRLLNEIYRALSEEIKATVQGRDQITWQGETRVVFSFYVIGE